MQSMVTSRMRCAADCMWTHQSQQPDFSPSCFLTSVQTNIMINRLHKHLSFHSKMSFMPDACEPFHARLAAYQHVQSLLLFVQTVDDVCLHPVCQYTAACCRFYSATCSDRFCSTCCAQIPVAVVDSEIRVADFRQMALLCVINLMNLKLTE